jgi:hypothetical protein
MDENNISDSLLLPDSALPRPKYFLFRSYNINNYFIVKFWKYPILITYTGVPPKTFMFYVLYRYYLWTDFCEI